ncbi:myotubularin-related protein 6 isoform X2 [Planococcus citri]|uniref:myotubularin-related protein 6 isoform X2 n=1 Tax=Planococcus citri TaxID=170843 RepID=UPI0031F7EDF4
MCVYMDELIRIPKVENVRMIDRYNARKPFIGNLFLTSSHLVFKDPEYRKELFYSHISSIEKLSLTTTGSPLLIRSKTFLCVTFVIPKDRDCHDVYTSLQQLSLPSSIENLYCFHCKSMPENIPQPAGWNFFDLQAEYQRMQVPNDEWCLTLLNKDYNLCDTYPKYLYVPTSATQNVLLGSSKFRSKGRLPVLSYLHKNKAVICRCSQPLSGFSARCEEDEQLLNCILQANPNCSFMYVVDTRPRINAMANRATGKGYENENFYENIKFQFFGIENIHVMRSSLMKLIESCDLKSSSVSNFLGGIDASGWLRHIKALLDAAWFMTQAVQNGISVVVHCSDGWDRTAQVCSLSSIMLDPYYRTIQGYQALIEKDWLAFGHKFSCRYGFIAGDQREISPIFTQFIEATWQLTCHFPSAFQFNEKYLLCLHDNFTSCQFGTFIGNCDKERAELRLSSRTFSFWGYVANHMNEFINPLYSTDDSQEILKPELCSQNFRFWRGLYCRFEPGVHPRENIEDIVLAISDHSSSLEDHINFLQKKIKGVKQIMSNSKDRFKGIFEDQFKKMNLNDKSPQEKQKKEMTNEACKINSLNDSLPVIEYQNDDVNGTINYMADEGEMKDSSVEVNTVATEWKSLCNVKHCVCLTPFEYSTKKFHCWKCGDVFCIRCMHNQHISLPGHLSKKTVPVCKTCFFKMTGSSFEEHIP